jgi:hypothetical protein
MLFIFSTPVLIRHMWQLKKVVFLHWCLMCVVLLLAYGAFSPYLVLGSDEVVDDVRAGRVAAGVAEPLLADVTSNHRSLEMSKTFSNHF